MAQKTLGEMRDQIFNGGDRHLYLHIGYFIIWYAMVEMRITMMLEVATKVPNPESFDLLTRGMDLRVKLHRLREACRKGVKLGPELKIRLDYLDEKVRGIRNNIAHSNITMSDNEEIHFSSISRMPFGAYGMQQLGPPPDSMSASTFFQYSLWLHAFAHDLATVDYSSGATEFEITNPKCFVPTEFRPTQQRKARPATPDTPPQMPSETQET